MRVKVDKEEVSQTINLVDLFDREPTSIEKINFINEAINLMIERTQSGKDVSNRDFRPYSEEYADKKGVSRGDVDLTLFGDMLSSIQGEVLGDKIKLEISGDEAIKAYAHMTGFEGHPTIKNGPKRRFFGLSNEEAQLIVENVRSTRTVRDFFEESEENIDDILSRIGIEFG